MADPRWRVAGGRKVPTHSTNFVRFHNNNGHLAGGVYPGLCMYTSWTQKQTPARPRGRHPTDPKADIPWADTPVQTPDEMTVEAGSTHTTGMNIIVSGGSRISPRRGHQLPRGGAPTYDFAKISQKLHEIERI